MQTARKSAHPIDDQGAMTFPKALLLIRHAEVEQRYHRVFSGRIDVELSLAGKQQASALANYLHSKTLHAVYASPMRRAQQTLAPLLANGFGNHTTLPDLREIDFGDWTGLAWDEVSLRFQVSAFSWLDQLECAAIPNAECGQTLRQRIEPCLLRIVKAHKGEKVGIVCHGGVIRVLLSILLDLPLSKMAAFEIDYASVTQIGVLAGKPVLQLLNYRPWL